MLVTPVAIGGISRAGPMQLPIFYGRSVNKIDSKGRVIVPPSIRGVIQKVEAEQTIALLPAFQGYACYEGFGVSHLKHVASQIDQVNPLTREYDAIAANMFAELLILPMDKEGRVVLPREVLDFVGIEEEVLFVGLNKKFQIWNQKNYDAHMAEMRELARSQPNLVPWGKEGGQ